MTDTCSPTALIADDEPLLRDELAQLLQRAWPALRVVAMARNGREAIEQFDALTPDVCFLDVHMPGISGVEAARHIGRPSGRRTQLVFVTAFDQYAVQAFAQGALDYLVKPVAAVRLADTVHRLQERLAAARPAPAVSDALLQQLAAQLRAAAGTASGSGTATAPLRWIKAGVGSQLRLIATDDIDYLRADSKYTLVAWRDAGGQPAEALISLPLKDLLAQLDPTQFAQVHRAVVVNLGAISHVTRGAGDTADIHLKGRREVLPVSRSHLHLFRQM